jgi:hypothetical protein
MSVARRLHITVMGSVLVVLVALAIAVVRHGDSGNVALPACARPAVTIARPGRLPRGFPLPAGTVFTRLFANRLTRGVPTVEGRMPLGLDQATRFLNQELPRKGFKLMLPQRARGEFAAFYEVKGFGGRIKVRTLPACRGATSFSVSARPTLLGRGNAQ